MEKTLKQRRKGFIAMLLVFLMVFESLPLEVWAANFNLGDISGTWDDSGIKGIHVVTGDTISWNGSAGDGYSVTYKFCDDTWYDPTNGYSRYSNNSYTIKKPSDFGKPAAYDTAIEYWIVDSVSTAYSGAWYVTSITLTGVGSLQYTVSWNYMDENGNPKKDTESVQLGLTPTHADPPAYSTVSKNYVFDDWTPAIAVVTGDAEYTATYTETTRQYNIEFVDDDDRVLKESVSYDYLTASTDIVQPATPTKAATAQYTYTFSGWDPELTTVIQDQTYKATYSASVNKYTITWKDDDGSTIKVSENMPYGSTPTCDAPSKASTASANYTFAGWTPNVVDVVGDATYTATYTTTPIMYTVSFNMMGHGNQTASQSIAYGSTAAEPTAPTETGYTFGGWYKESGLTNAWNFATDTVTSNTELFAKWTINQYKITFVDYDGTVLKPSVSYNYNTPSANITKPTDPTRAEDNYNTYTFKGWEPALSDVTQDQVYTASYNEIPRLYTITWKDENDTVLGTDQLGYGVMPSREDPVKASTVSQNYTFAGWTPAVVPVSGNATYKASYTASVKQYTIRFVDGTTELSSALYDYGTLSGNIAKPVDPTKDQDAQYTYTFSGWSPALEDVKRDITYTAQFTNTLRRYTVTWVNYDGSVLEIDSNVPYGDMPSYNGSTPAKPDDSDTKYSFAGWSPSVTNVTRDITYTATFTGTTTSYPITWKDDDGTIIEVTRVAAGATPTHADPMKPATAEYTYTFSGWTPEIVPATAPATYTATYTAVKNKYKITWLDDLGKEIDTTEVEYGVVPTHADAVKQDTEEYTYTFDGWDPEPVAVTEDAVYSAKFKEKRNTFTITWKNDDGSTIDTTEVSYGEMPSHADPTKKDTAKYKYTFKGWTPTITAATADATYTAEYDSEQKVYKVTWQDYDGSILGVQKYHYGDRPSFGDPSRPADDKYEYVFTGWSPAIRPVTSNATYIAQYDAKTLVGAGDKDPSSDSDNSSSRVKNVAQQVNTNNASGTPVKSPQTGGEDPMRTAAMAVLILSSTATAALIIRRRRRQNTK